MRCPICNSIETRKVSVMDPFWFLGAKQCCSCEHQNHWTYFCEENQGKMRVYKLRHMEGWCVFDKLEDVMSELSSLLPEVDDKFEITAMEMTPKEFEQLAEFEGW